MANLTERFPTATEEEDKKKSLVDRFGSPDTSSIYNRDTSLKEYAVNEDPIQRWDDNQVSLYSEAERLELIKQGPIGIGEAFERQRLRDLLPFSPFPVVDAFSVKNAVERLQDNKYDSEQQRDEDERKVFEFMRKIEEERIRGFSWGGKVYSIASQMPAFMLEFAATGGLASIAKKGLAKGGIKLAQVSATKGAKAMAQKLAIGSAKYAGEAALRTPWMINHYTKGYAENQIFANVALTDKGVEILEAPKEGKFTSFVKAYGDTFIEVGSEMAGQRLFKPATGAIGSKLTKGLSPQVKKGIGNFMNKISANGKITAAFEIGGFNGIIEEIGEEILGDQLRAAFGIQEFSDDPDANILDQMRAAVPGWDDLSVMAGAFAIPGVTSQVGQRLYDRMVAKGMSSKDVKMRLKNLSQKEQESILADLMQTENKDLVTALKKGLSGEELTDEEQFALKQKYDSYSDKGFIKHEEVEKKQTGAIGVLHEKVGDKMRPVKDQKLADQMVEKLIDATDTFEKLVERMDAHNLFMRGGMQNAFSEYFKKRKAGETNQSFSEWRRSSTEAAPDAAEQAKERTKQQAKMVMAIEQAKRSLASFEQEHEHYKSNIRAVASEKFPLEEEVPADKALSIFRKSGLTKEEIEYTGIEDFLKTKKKFTRQELIDYIDQHKLQIEVTIKSSKRLNLNMNSKYATPIIVAHLNRAIESEPDMDPDGLSLWIANTSEIYDELNRKFPGLTEQDNWEEVVMKDLVPENYKVGRVRYNTANLTLPGGEDYMEILVQLPRRLNVLEQRKKQLDREWNALKSKMIRRLQLLGWEIQEMNLHNYTDEMNEEERKEFDRLQQAFHDVNRKLRGMEPITPRDRLGGEPEVVPVNEENSARLEDETGRGSEDLKAEGISSIFIYPAGEIIYAKVIGGFRAEITAANGDQANYENPVLHDVEQWLVRALDIPENVGFHALRGPEDVYTHPHWEEKNILFHIRLNFREDADGNKVLFIEELQSDWHKAARTQRANEIKRIMREENISKEEAAKKVPFDFGYRGDVEAELVAKRKELQRRRGEIIDRGSMMLEEGGTTLSIQGEDKAELDRINEELANMPDAAYKADDLVPDAPFKQSWQELGINKAIEIAIQEGAQKIAWINGEQSADRYNLWKYYDYVNYRKNPDGTYYMYAQPKEGYGSGTEKWNLTEQELIDHIGQDNFERIKKEEGEVNASETEQSIVERGKPVGVFQKHYNIEETKDGKLIIVEKLITGDTKKLTRKSPGKVKTYRVINTSRNNLVVGDYLSKVTADAVAGEAEHLKVIEFYIPALETERANIGRTYRKRERAEIESTVRRLNSSWYIKFESGKELGTYVSQEDAEKEAAGMIQDYWANPMRRLDVTGYRKGGEKHIGFYDKMLPTVVKNYIKKWGGKVEMIKIKEMYQILDTFKSYEEGREAFEAGNEEIYAQDYGGADHLIETEDDLRKAFLRGEKVYAESMTTNEGEQMGFEITPMMRVEVSRIGQPLFGSKLAGVKAEAVEAFADNPDLVEEIVKADEKKKKEKAEPKLTRKQKYQQLKDRIAELRAKKAGLKEMKAAVKDMLDFAQAQRKEWKNKIKRYKDGYLDEEFNALPVYYRTRKGGQTLDDAATEAGFEGDMEFRDYLINLGEEINKLKEDLAEINAQIKEEDRREVVQKEITHLKQRVSDFEAGRKEGTKDLADLRKEATAAARKLLPKEGKRFFNKILTAINSIKTEEDVGPAIAIMVENYENYLDRMARAKAIRDIMRKYKKPQNIFDIKFQEKIQNLMDSLVEKAVYTGERVAEYFTEISEEGEVSPGDYAYDNVKEEDYELKELDISQVLKKDEAVRKAIEGELEPMAQSEGTIDSPIIINSQGEVLDGYHRLRGRVKAGKKKVTAYVGIKKGTSSRAIQRKALKEMNTEELLDLAKQITDLREKGRWAKQRKDEMKLMAKEIMRLALIKAAGGSLDPQVIESQQEKKLLEKGRIDIDFGRPLRVIRMIFGKFGERIFYNSLDVAEMLAQHLKMVRLKAIHEILRKRMKMSMSKVLMKIGETVEIDGVEFQLNNIMTMYAQRNNQKARAAIIYGNNMGEALYNKFVKYLEENEPALAQAVDEIKEVVGNRYDELREVMREHFNMDLPKEEDYFPMHRKRFDDQDDPDPVMGVDILRDQVRRGGQGISYTAVEKGFTIKREDIADENQKPISMDFMEDAARAIDTQEHFIQYAPIQKMWNTLKGDPALQDAVRYNHGERAWQVFEQYMDEAINPRMYYKGLGRLGKIVKNMRRALGIFFLGFNVVTAMKQFPSAHLALKHTSLPQLYWSMLKTRFSKKLQNKILKLDPSIEQRIVEREIGEIMQGVSKLNRNDYLRQIQIWEQQLGEGSMRWILNMDRWAVMSVFDAVYERNKHKLGHEAAVELAHKTILETQPQGRRIDLPAAYRTQDQGVRMMLMFTNQLNQIYNMLTFDAPSEWKNKQKKEAIVGIGSIMLSSMMIYAASHGGKWPDDDEEQWKAWLEAIAGSAISSIPLIGNFIMTDIRGFAPSLLPADAIIDSFKYSKQKFANEEYLEGSFDIMMYIAILLGARIPANAVRRTMRGIADLNEGDTDDIRRLIWSKSALFE
jgi:hypothetical protein